MFLHQRVFEDIMDRLTLMRRSFTSALLVGCPDPSWEIRLRQFAPKVDRVDPGPLFAAAADGGCIVEDRWTPSPGSYDLCVAIGTLDSVNDLPRALLTLRLALMEGGLLLGAMSGGETLPQLRAAMRAADESSGHASPHVHPRIEPAALGALLANGGFEQPVVDVDRVRVSYRTLNHLTADLRKMAATNVLAQRSRTPLSRAASAAASAAFAALGNGRSTVETFEILHFAGWARSLE